MALEVYSQVGSGTLPFTRSILPPSQRGNALGAQGHRGGTQVMVGNPEDVVAVDAFATSGITVGSSTPVEILSPGTNPLPRCRQVIIENGGNQNVLIGHNDQLNSLDSYILEAAGQAGDRVTLPILHNVSVWALSTTGDQDIHLLIF